MEEEIITRIAELQDARRKLIAEAERGILFIDGGIIELTKLLNQNDQPPDPDVTPENQ